VAVIAAVARLIGAGFLVAGDMRRTSRWRAPASASPASSSSA